MQFKIKTQSKASKARTGIIKTPHGLIHTPYFIPVATAATVRGLNQEDMKAINAEPTKTLTNRTNCLCADNSVRFKFILYQDH